MVIGVVIDGVAMVSVGGGLWMTLKQYAELVEGNKPSPSAKGGF